MKREKRNLIIGLIICTIALVIILCSWGVVTYCALGGQESEPLDPFGKPLEVPLPIPEPQENAEIVESPDSPESIHEPILTPVYLPPEPILETGESLADKIGEIGLNVCGGIMISSIALVVIGLYAFFVYCLVSYYREQKREQGQA